MQKKSLSLLLCLSLSACTTTNPYTGEQQTSNATVGALSGAMAGAVLGAATGDKKHQGQRAVKGALLGGAIGGGVGHYMDVQESKLREKLKGTGVSVSRDPNSNVITLNMPGNITFPSAGSDLRDSFYKTLNSVALVLKEYAKTQVEVAGYTDSVGDERSNLALSQRRAQAVSNYLKGQGIASRRLQAVGYGESSPIASNMNEAGRAQNRRVQVQILPPSNV